jgi:hypothetical protein
MVLKNLFSPSKKRKSKLDTSKFIQQNFFNLVVLILVVVLLLKSCKSTPSGDTQIKVIRDTTWIIKDSTIYSKPQLIKTIPVDVSRDTIINHYLPDTNYSKLLAQYQEVVKKYLETNLYSDSVGIDTIGYVKVTDTISQNQLLKRGYRINVKYPIITETIIKPAPKVRQVYAGGQLSGIAGSPVNGINAGLLYKTKKDYIIGANAGFDRNGNILYGLQSYWKIKLKK